jgi:hypothetical protein
VNDSQAEVQRIPRHRQAPAVGRNSQTPFLKTLTMNLRTERFYISWQHPWNYILDSGGTLIARSKLKTGWGIFDTSKIMIEFENEHLMKYRPGGIGSIIFNMDKIIKQKGNEIFRFKPTDKWSTDYSIICGDHIIKFSNDSKKENYQILSDNSICGHIKHDSEFNCPFPYKKIGTEIMTPTNISKICILFAIISKDYFGPAT